MSSRAEFGRRSISGLSPESGSTSKRRPYAPIHRGVTAKQSFSHRVNLYVKENPEGLAEYLYFHFRVHFACTMQSLENSQCTLTSAGTTAKKSTQAKPSYRRRNSSATMSKRIGNMLPKKISFQRNLIPSHSSRGNGVWRCSATFKRKLPALLLKDIVRNLVLGRRRDSFSGPSCLFALEYS